jgi:iron complex transport system ATP-binding protein
VADAKESGVTVKLHVEQVGWNVEKQPIIREICLDVHPGEFIGLIGPNGSGKSTLLHCVYRALKPQAGFISLEGQDLATMPPRQAAQQMAVVLQETPMPFDFTVREMVFMGRTPHKTLFENDTRADETSVDEALRQVNMTAFAERSFSTLSGGEKQRVLIARALAQQTEFLVLDEPTNHLDIRYQLEILDLVKYLRVTTLAALHDLNLAAFYCDRLYLLCDGEVVAQGTPEDILTAALIRDVYGVSADVVRHPVTGKPHITYFPAGVGERRNT